MKLEKQEGRCRQQIDKKKKMMMNKLNRSFWLSLRSGTCRVGFIVLT